jgi:hypothetical protein
MHKTVRVAFVVGALSSMAQFIGHASSGAWPDADDKTVLVYWSQKPPHGECEAVTPDTTPVRKLRHVEWWLIDTGKCDGKLAIVPEDPASWGNDLKEVGKNDKKHKFLVKDKNQARHKYKVTVDGRVVLDPWIEIS